MLGGPTGAIVCGRRTSDGEAFTSTVNRAFLANQDASRYPVLPASLLPFCDGTDEAPRVIDNATAFKAALEAEGLPTLLPGEIAASHQVVVPTGKLPETLSLMRALENASILAGRCPHPGTPDGYGLRFGTQYATRLGLGTTEMEAAARIVGRLMGRRDATARLVEGHAEKIPNVCEAIQSLLAPFSINKDRAPYEAT
jgi:glycine/serine hydroxymethyltransferase